MSFNKFMHPRNIYRNPPDFKELSIKYPEFREYAVQNLSGKVHIDFKDPPALRTLTTILLHRDFGLDVEIPPNHLIPTLPQRLNYILWVEDLLNVLPHKEDIRGIDIGTGPCCIYPLLGCKKNNWKFLATESNTESFEWAVKNVQRNKYDNEIKLVKVDSGAALEKVISETKESFDFIMCNPPFFQDLSEANASKSRTSRRPNPKSKNTASFSEKLTEGGEVEFVKKIISDSLVLKEKIRLYTTMLGKKQSFQIIKGELRSHEMIYFTSCEFCQGNTMRWGIAWTYLEGVQFQQVPVLKHQKKKLPITYTVVEKKEKFEYSINGILTAFKKLLDDVKIPYQVTSAGKYYACLHLRAKENTWSHQRRKRREQQRHQKSMQEKMELCDEQIPVAGDVSVVKDPEKESQGNICEVPMDIECEAECMENNSSKKVSGKRERSVSPSGDISEPKKLRKDEPMEESQVQKCSLDCSFLQESVAENTDILPEEHLLWCDVSFRYKEKTIFLKMECPDSMNREPMHQVLQLFKNNLQ